MDNTDIAKLRWACRRGMLELDLIFENYVNQHYSNSSIQEQQAFKGLLNCNDQELYNWLVKREPAEPQHAQMVKKLIEYALHS